jgi:integrase
MKEAEIKFILKTPSALIATPVYLKYTCKDGTMRYSTSQKCIKADWDKINQRPVHKRLYRALDAQITRLTAWTESFIKTVQREELDVLQDDLFNYLRKKEGKAERQGVVKKGSFFQQIRSLIDDAKAGRLTVYNSGEKNGNLYSAGTLKHWELAFNKLEEFDPEMTWNITLETYNEFVSWCNQKGFMPNYTGTIIKIWKVFMNLGFGKKWHNNIVHLDRRFKKLTEKKYKIYLNEEEIQALINIDLKGNLKIIRDFFIININTGLRISDMKELTIESFKEGIIRSINRKTGVTTAVPANGDVKRIIGEYNGFPINPFSGKAFHEFTINRFIKKIARQAGITDVIEFTETVGGKKVKIQKEKCDLITCHTCRRSFITNKLKAHVSIADVSKFAGSTIKNIEHYNKETVEEVALRYLNSPVFR